MAVIEPVVITVVVVAAAAAAAVASSVTEIVKPGHVIVGNSNGKLQTLTQLYFSSLNQYDTMLWRYISQSVVSAVISMSSYDLNLDPS